METGHPSTRAVNSGGGNRALDWFDSCSVSVCIQMDMWTVVRMLCLLSVTTGGLQPALYASLKTQFAHVCLLTSTSSDG